jgi:hypothetical protein
MVMSKPMMAAAVTPATAKIDTCDQLIRKDLGRQNCGWSVTLMGDFLNGARRSFHWSNGVLE